MAYVPNATDTAQPTGDKFVASAAPEFRTLKTFTVGLNVAMLGFQAQLTALQAAIGAGTNSVALAANLALGTGSQLVGFLQAGTGAVLRNLFNKVREAPVSPEDFGAVGDGVTNDYLAMNLAFAASTTLKLTNGKNYFIGNNTLIVPANSPKIYSDGPRASTRITRTVPGPILTTPENCIGMVIDNVYFTGVGNTGIFTPTAGVGPFRSYLIQANIKNCDFGWELDYGIRSNFIYMTMERCNYGMNGIGTQPAPGTGTFKCFDSRVGFAANYSNLNRYIDCIFNAGGGAAVAAVTIVGGIVNRFERCDFSNGGLQFSGSDIGNLYFDSCWSESCATLSAGVGTFAIDGSTGPTMTNFINCQFAQPVAAVGSFVKWTSGIVNPSQRITMHDCILALSANGTVFYDGNTAIRLRLPGAGNIIFYNNQVSGGAAGNRLLTSTDFRGGTGQPRAWGRIDTSGAGSFLSKSDPSMTIARTGAGDCTVSNLPIDLYITGPASAVPITGGIDGAATQGAIFAASATSVRVILRNVAGAAVDGISSFIVYGAP